MADEKKPEGKKKEGMGLRGLFLTGLIFILPLYITFILLKLVIAWLKGTLHNTFHLLFELTFGRVLGDFYDRIEWMFLFLIGLPVVLAFIVIVGWAAKNVLGKRILRWAESSVRRVPLLGGIYSSSRQLVDTVFLKGKASYQRVVLVEYPRRGCWVFGFVTGEGKGEVKRGISPDGDEDVYSVFVPTTPNPTSGFLCYFRRSEVKSVEISVEDGLKLVISGGILIPEEKPKELPAHGVAPSPG
jgi:uncharacterized membrane protein